MLLVVIDVERMSDEGVEVDGAAVVEEHLGSDVSVVWLEDI